jgi:hypothetical protein
MRRYLRYQPDKDMSNGVRPGSNPPSSGAMLSDLKKVLESSAFGRFLERVTGLRSITGSRGEIRRFRPGRDYTVAHYGLLRPWSVLDATLVFCAGDGNPVDVDGTAPDDSSPDVQWQSGDVGGFECYIEVDERGEDEEYRSASLTQTNGNVEHGDEEQDDTELLSVSAANNTLSLVYRDPGTMRFVKYVSYQAPSSRWDVSMEYRVEPSEEDDLDDDDEEEIGVGDPEGNNESGGEIVSARDD